MHFEHIDISKLRKKDLQKLIGTYVYIKYDIGDIFKAFVESITLERDIIVLQYNKTSKKGLIVDSECLLSFHISNSSTKVFGLPIID